MRLQLGMRTATDTTLQEQRPDEDFARYVARKQIAVQPDLAG